MATNEESQTIETLQENMCVRVFGRLQSFTGKTDLHIFSIEPVTDLNEVTHHMLEVVYIHCQNTKGPLNGAAASKGGVGASPAGSMVPQGGYMGGVGAGAYNNGMGMPPARDNDDTQLMKMVFEVMKQSNDNNMGGLTVAVIQMELRNQKNVNK
jgi:replication factor A2